MDFSQFLNMREEISLLIVIFLVFFADLFFCKEQESDDKLPESPIKSPIGLITIALFSIHTILNLLPSMNGMSFGITAFGGMYTHTPIMTVVKTILNIGTLVCFLMAYKWLQNTENSIKQGEFYLITLFTVLGMYLMISSGHFLMFFFCLELASIPMTALVAFDKKRY